jgi:uncharacterized protein (TIGR03067 family)
MLRNQPLLVGLAVVVLGLPCNATIAWAQDAAVKRELKALEGAWDLKSASQSGEEKTFRTGMPTYLVFTAGGKVTITVPISGDDDHPATYTINPRRKPQTMDVAVEKVDGVFKWIYELKGDELRVATVSYPGGGGVPGKRPGAFSGKDVYVFVYSRGK